MNRTFDNRVFLAYVACSLAAIFYLPLLVQQAPTASVSYVFGYNNRVGVVLVLLLTAIGAVWTKGLNLKLCTNEVSDPLPFKMLVLSLLAVLSACLATYRFAGQFGGFGESIYFIDRAWLITQGKTPYVDFEWAYGVFFLYAPILVHHLLSINIALAYYLCWIFNFLLGTLLLFLVVNMVDYPSKARRSIFLLLFGSMFICILCMGTNYTYMRYTCPLFFILIVQNLLKGSSPNSRAYAAVLAVVFTIVLLLISSEIAIAHAFACVTVFLLTSPIRSRRNLAIFAVMTMAFALVFGAALRLHMLDMIKTDGGGADSFPVTLAPHLLLFFAAIFVCASYLFRRFSQQSIHDNTIGLVAFSIPMLAAALGRCDPGHVATSGEGFFLASMFYVSNYRSIWKWYKVAFVIFIILLPAISGTLLYLPSIEKVRTNSPAETLGLPSLYPSWHGAFLAPFGYKPNGIGTYLSNQVDYGHYEGLENANTVAAIQEKITEIKSQPEKALLLPTHFEAACPASVAGDKFVMSLLFAFPYYGKPVHLNGVHQPICDYILARYSLEYEPTKQNFGYGLWVLKPA